MLRNELDFFIQNQGRLVAEHRGKVLVIAGQQVMGAYTSPTEALREGAKRYPVGEFLIQPCEPGPQAYTVTVGPLTA